MEQKKTIKPKTPNKSEKRGVYRKTDYKAFVKFYAMPSVFRQDEYGYRTEQDFAKKFDLCQDTLTDWKKRPEFEKDVDSQLNKWGGGKTPDVIAALYRTILKDGKASEVKLWLQYIKRWKEGMIVEQPPLDMASIAKAVREVNKEENDKRDNKGSQKF